MYFIKEASQLQIPLHELSDATNRFSEQNLIGRGGFGKVYKGISAKHGIIAIKMLDPWQDQRRDREFRMEIVLLSSYKHENMKVERRCLFMSMKATYLHDGVGFHHRVIHRDIKSSNILLGENWKAKITYFGLSNMVRANTDYFISNACGTIGYIDPDYMRTGILTKESDVYSFGVVLFEVLCGRPARLREPADEDQFLTSVIKRHWERKTLDEVIHPDLKNQINQASLLTFATIAYQCLMDRRLERPTMEKVMEQLEKALDKQLANSDLWWNDDDIACAAADAHQGQAGYFLIQIYFISLHA
ncbi:receptor-like protein kinase ANXUR2 [Bidens hawaiensis]|uniref:receptor-like protein kinase ANXUR2 n=1 Tax=Bidens hawaiensis TaxID=980011 RepID=UPI00404AD255